MQGLSLIEIMIALLIGSILILGLVQVFAASRTAYQMSEGMARVQENARFALDFIQRDLRMAGHFGCINDQSHLQVAGAMRTHFGAPGVFDPLNFTVSVAGYEAPGTAPGSTVQVEAEPALGTLPGALGTLDPAPLPGSDVLVLRYLSSMGVPVTNIVDIGSTEEVTVPAGIDGVRWRPMTQGGRTEPGIYGVADCSYVDVFEGTVAAVGADMVITVEQPGASQDTDLAGRYTPHPSGQTVLYRGESLVYYVGVGTGGGPALHRAYYDTTLAEYVEEELVEGIASLQVIYGLDREADLANNPPTGYIDEIDVAQAAWGETTWRRVGMVQVGLMAVSPSRAAAEQADSRQVLGVDFTPPAANDGMYRSGYESSVALRNRLYGN
ncbi:PilW family protein [Luteimonas sp. SJ-92]|uniref:PilW family protein n=2 Tax=Luteimonas salinisoli TaxID=2752307 RepID=A0A853JAS5_9GAMM|nr:PilW family protein [Luteimonas salinisoli]NZA26301.1 PilW family protein [Luteimonas salinisoli]